MSIHYVKGKPYFSDAEQKIKQYPYLNQNMDCEVLIIGGGINGAIANYYFSGENIDTILIEKNKIGYTSTACATALLEYQLDDHAEDLNKYLNKKDVVNAYHIGLEALLEIDNIIKKLGNHCEYSRRNTLSYTLEKCEVKELKKEYEFRKQNNFNVEFLLQENNPFPFKIEAGLLAKDKGAQFNPYLFTKQLIEKSKNQNKIFENTEAIKIEKLTNGKMKVVLRYGFEIICDKIICSTGYNTTLFTHDKLCEKLITYSIVTNVIKNFSWEDKAMLQDNSDPYHYIRLTDDNRLVIGGEDIAFKNDIMKEKKAKKKYQNLLEYTKNLLPQIADQIEVAYEFCGVFSATNNNLGIFGESKENKNVWYCLGYGANGIVNCIYGARMLLEKYKGNKNKFEKYFSVNRELV